MANTSVPQTVEELASQVRDLRTRDVMSRRAQWLLLLEGITQVFGGHVALQQRGAMVTFTAEPADDSCRCHGEPIHSRLTEVRQTFHEKLRLVERPVGRRARESLTAVWSLLGDVLLDIVRSHVHSGFAFDFSQGILGCWHDWSCLPCTGGMPCIIVDLVTEGPVDVSEMPYVVGVNVLGPPAPAGLEPGDPRRPQMRTREELCQQLWRRMHELSLSPPCLVLTESHGEEAGDPAGA